MGWYDFRTNQVVPPETFGEVVMRWRGDGQGEVLRGHLQVRGAAKDLLGTMDKNSRDGIRNPKHPIFGPGIGRTVGILHGRSKGYRLCGEPNVKMLNGLYLQTRWDVCYGWVE